MCIRDSNGIIENFEAIKASLQARGYVFTSETDTEAIAHLVHSKLQVAPDLFEAVRLATNELIGAYAIGVLAEADPCLLYTSPSPRDS